MESTRGRKDSRGGLAVSPTAAALRLRTHRQVRPTGGQDAPPLHRDSGLPCQPPPETEP